jgi:hypothetical protein
VRFLADESCVVRALRHTAAAALLGWYLVLVAFVVVPVSSLAASSKSKLSTYTNQTYGFSFRYPSDWALKEGDPVKLSWGYLGPVENVLPHGTTVAAVVVPLKPDTGDNFAPQFLSVSVDTTLTAHECDRFVPAHKVWAEPDPLASHPIVKIGAIRFAKAEDSSAGLGHDRSAQYYHVFKNQTCYEFELGIVASLDPTEGVYDEELRELKAILATVTIRPTTVAVPPTPVKVK